LEKKDDKWCMSGDLQHLLKDTELEAPGGVYDVDSPEDHYDINSTGFVFDAAAPVRDGQDPRHWSSTHVYYAPIDSFARVNSYRPRQISVGAFALSGVSSNVRFSPDGSMVAFLFRPEKNYVDSRIYMGHLNSFGVFDVFKMVIGGGPYLPPDGFEFAGDSETLLLKTEDCGRVTIQRLKLSHRSKPETIFRNGVVAGFHPLVSGKWDKILVSSTSIVDSSLWQVIDVNMEEEPRVVSSLTKHGARFGLSHKMISEIWYEGCDESVVHSFIIKPSDFDESKKYPWILLPHGGPQSAWTDGWSTRVGFPSTSLRIQLRYPNWTLTGLSGTWRSGQNKATYWSVQTLQGAQDMVSSFWKARLCAALSSIWDKQPLTNFNSGIFGSWGGAPYQDIVNLMQYLEQLPYLDMDRAILAGASYGGYMISWIFGHHLAKRVTKLQPATFSQTRL
jgi:hypothetical protein